MTPHQHFNDLISVILVNIGALSLNLVNQVLGVASLLASLIYTSIKIYQLLKNRENVNTGSKKQF
jgi:uncharacterized membrane protein YuzA (DUF378 family)